MINQVVKSTEEAVFIIPHWRSENDHSFRYFQDTLKGIFNQSDPHWKIVIVDDCSPCKEALAYLKFIETKYPDKIKIIYNNENQGPGYCRNIGIQWAYQSKAAFVLFNDADDISHKDRLAIVRGIFHSDPVISVVYSTFNAIDEANQPIEMAKLPQCIIEILDSHKNNPPEGLNAWIDIGTETGYTNLTSATAVRTEIAKQFPFPSERVSEDTHTWFRYSAGGGKFFYTEKIPTLYRIPQAKNGTSTMSRMNSKSHFLEKKARVDLDGFKIAFELAVKNQKILSASRNDLMVRFHIKLSETMVKEQEYRLAMEQIDKAYFISKKLTDECLLQRGLKKSDLINW